MNKASDEKSLRRHFDHVDLDGNGRIDEAEFARLLVILGLQRESGVVATAFRDLDRDGNGSVDFDEFRRWWSGFAA